ncbi:DUF805 domain-containing protein [Roseibacterium beibuensis]|uniref:DUF805 domain-containing protein n=1 Tax=[Roseibacterium] beibuensis TaxID=1193142 RepID=UPI00217E8436|nr:DUF805 domain-containing protein [Roseibacterium beibuensis]MCS6627020.1 DUF805 domain-containing protein [Roseibacterium beibuensis]
MSLKNKLFSFGGRLRRRDWWVWGIALGLGHNLLLYVSAHALGLNGPTLTGGYVPVIGDPWPAVAHSIAITLLFAWPQLALTFKRAHDLDRPAWSFVAVSVGIQALSYWPVDEFFVSGPSYEQTALWGQTQPWLISGASLLGALYLIVVLGFLDGTRGPNRFGRSPKGIGGDMPDQTAGVFS